MRKKMLFLLLFSAFLAYGTENVNPPKMKLIRGGEFEMGKKADGNAAESPYSPVHRVIVDSFYMDIHEVTNKEYYIFCQKTKRKLPEFWGNDKYKSGLKYPNHPVLGVSKYDARAYAKFVGKRLPTEAEWEYAARGGLIGKDFSNGDDFSGCINLDLVMKKGIRSPYPVLAGKPNNFGLYGMCGNVREWVSDIYDKNYYKVSPKKNPQGPKKGRLSVVRGGGWKSGTSCKKLYIRNALRGSWVDIAVGFRCVKDLKTDH